MLDDIEYDDTPAEQQPIETNNRRMNFLIIMGLVLVFMWTFSLVLNIVTASKLNKMIAFGKPVANRKTIKSLLDTMAAAFALFWYPFVNVGMSMAFAFNVNKIS